jgi:histidine kinase
MSLFKDVSLNKKIFFTFVVVTLLVSAAIAFLARWIIVSSLTTELKHRGAAIAQSIGERARGYILDNNAPQLVALVFDAAYLGERKDLVAYIFVTAESEVLAHTFITPFPEELAPANKLRSGAEQSVELIDINGAPVYDIAVPITEGIYRLGEVHVGIDKSQIDTLIAKLRNIFLGFLSIIVVFMFLLSLRMANYISLPIRKLTRISDELSRGNFDISPEIDEAIADWSPQDCPAYKNTDLPCWHFDQQGGWRTPTNQHQTCARCRFYQKTGGDEVRQLADSFRNMVWSIKLYRRRLRESEEKYRSLFDSGPDPILVADFYNLDILDANPRSEEMYGFGKHELIGMSMLQLDPDFHLHLEDAQDSLDKGLCLYRSKLLQYKKGGEPFFVNMHACPISYRNAHALIIAVADITEMMEKDAQLIQASKMKTLGEMSAGIAHEINQPLNAIKMGSEYLQMVTERAQDPANCIPAADLGPVAGEISTQVDRATEIINTLRAFGRKAELTKDQIQVNDTVRAVMNIVGQQFKLAGIELELHLAQELPAIMAHSNKLQQVLFNLLTNARDAIMAKDGEKPAKGLISIATAQHEGRVVISVTDDGVGIAPEEEHKIFEPFFTTKEVGQGMGLGLAISYGIVKEYDGELTITSQPGEGATFSVAFPAKGGAPPRSEQ